MEVLETREVAGVTVVKFNPTPPMKAFAISAFLDPSVSGKSPEEICRAAGVSAALYKKFLSFEPQFSEWLEDFRISIGGKNRRAALEAVGYQEALKGDFAFWKVLAVKEGIISHDRLDIGAAIPANLGAFNNFSEDQLSDLRDSLLSGLRSVEDAGTINLAEGPGGWQPEGDSTGVIEVPEGQMALDEGMGLDGKCGLHEIESF